MIVDCHAHVIPGRLPGGTHPSQPHMTPCEDGDSRTLTIEDVEFVASPVWFEADRRLAAMDEAGVDMEVVSPMPPLLNYNLPLDEAVPLFRHVNEWIAALASEGAGRIQGFGSVPLQDPDAAAAQLAEVASAGLRGVEVASHIRGTSIGDPRFRDFFAEVERLDLAVFVHAIRPPHTDRLPKEATASFGFMGEAALAAASLVTDGTLAACPSLRVSISHGAGGFPATIGRAQYFALRSWLGHDDATGLPTSTDEPTPLDLARRLYYDSLVFDSRAIEFIARRLGRDRILLGSDFPAIPRSEPLIAPFADVSALSDDLPFIAGSNALAFLAIEESGF